MLSQSGERTFVGKILSLKANGKRLNSLIRFFHGATQDGR